jgi:hypothetical protein
MVDHPHELIHVAHPDVDGTAVVPRSSLPHMVGWEEVDAPETGPSSDAYDHELIEVTHPGIEGTAQVLRSSLGQMDGEWTEVSDEGDVDLEELNKPDLKAEAEKRGLPTSGTKAELADAITAHDEQASQDTQPADVATLEEK